MKRPGESSTEKLPYFKKVSCSVRLQGASENLAEKLIFLIRNANFRQAAVELTFKCLKYSGPQSLGRFLKRQRRHWLSLGGGLRQCFRDRNGGGGLGLFVGGEAFFALRSVG